MQEVSCVTCVSRFLPSCTKPKAPRPSVWTYSYLVLSASGWGSMAIPPQLRCRYCSCAVGGTWACRKRLCLVPRVPGGGRLSWTRHAAHRRSPCPGGSCRVDVEQLFGSRADVGSVPQGACCVLLLLRGGPAIGSPRRALRLSSRLPTTGAAGGSEGCHERHGGTSAQPPLDPRGPNGLCSTPAFRCTPPYAQDR